jgi:hypothetical protein
VTANRAGSDYPGFLNDSTTAPGSDYPGFGIGLPGIESVPDAVKISFSGGVRSDPPPKPTGSDYPGFRIGPCTNPHPTTNHAHQRCPTRCTIHAANNNQSDPDDKRINPERPDRVRKGPIQLFRSTRAHIRAQTGIGPYRSLRTLSAGAR